jgi:hypothetical protein
MGLSTALYRNSKPVFASFLLDLPFDFEDGGDMFRRNVGLSPDYTALERRRYY